LILALAGVVVWRLATLTSHTRRPRGRFAGPAQPVGVTTVGTHDIRIVLNELGTVTSLATITVQPQLSGVLTKLAFAEGQIVQKGAFLAQIDPRPYQVALEQYQGQLLRDQAALKEAQIDLARYQKLQQEDSIANQTVDDQAQQVQQDIGTVRLDQAQVDAQKLNLTYCHITSPVTGRVGIRQVDPGNYLQSNATTGIVVVTQLEPISIIFSVPEDAVPMVYKQFHSGTPLQVVAYDRANVAQLATGTLSAIDTQIDTTTGTVKMRAMFLNVDDVLYPDQFVNVRLLANVLRNVVAVPKEAVQYGPSGPFVYALSAGNTVNIRALQLGTQDGDLIAVNSGLSAGDRVVIDGTDQLRDNTRVSIRDEGVPGVGGGASAQPRGYSQQPSGHRPHGGQGRRRPAAGDVTQQGQNDPSQR
jgi:multidrug efflux system membrane fusion protein